MSAAARALGRLAAGGGLALSLLLAQSLGCDYGWRGVLLIVLL